MLPAGSSTQNVLKYNAISVALDSAGDLYFADRSKVQKVTAGSSTPIVLPFIGLQNADAVAVDGSGNVYVLDSVNNQVVKLPTR